MINTPIANDSDFIMRNTNSAIDEILRGEISANEAYQQVFEEIKHDPEITRLQQLRADHSEAVKFWKDQVRSELSYPEETSGIWGTAVDAFVGASKLLGEKTALAALKKGEEHGLENYRKMLKKDELTAKQKSEIRTRFIPSQQNHITALNALLKIQ